MIYEAVVGSYETGDAYIKLSSSSDTLIKGFESLEQASEEAEDVGIFDAQAKRLFVHKTDRSARTYRSEAINLDPAELAARGFERPK